MIVGTPALPAAVIAGAIAGPASGVMITPSTPLRTIAWKPAICCAGVWVAWSGMIAFCSEPVTRPAAFALADGSSTPLSRFVSNALLTAMFDRPIFQGPFLPLNEAHGLLRTGPG